ncbi:MAG: PhzF family phenazine biosynthesis protein [Anaerolineales bacterium]
MERTRNALNIAQEFGFSETAFVQSTKKDGTYTIKFFSPKKGNPTVRTRHACGGEKIIFDSTTTEIIFIASKKLELLIKKQNDEILMEFPVYDTVPATVPAETLTALGLEDVVNTVYSPKNKIIVLEISDPQLLASLTPDFEALLTSYNGINGVLVTARSADKEYDFHYRYFWPWAGTNEDPVTGGVQTFLAKYWAEKLGKNRMNVFQSSKRTGRMTVELQNNKVIIFGKAVIVLEGNLNY